MKTLPGGIFRHRKGKCRGADSRARRRTYSPYKAPSKWQTLPICHCEEANGRRGALSAKREEVPLGCNLAVPGRNVGKPSAKSQLPSRDCHVASLLAMTRQGGAVVHQSTSAVECPLLGAQGTPLHFSLARRHPRRDFFHLPHCILLKITGYFL